MTKRITSTRLNIQEEAALRQFATDYRISVSEAMRLAIGRLGEKERRERAETQLNRLEADIHEFRDTMKRTLQLLIITTTANDETFKAQALAAFSKIYPEGE